MENAQLSFDDATIGSSLVSNNLGGQGPSYADAHELRYAQVGVVSEGGRAHAIVLVVTNTSEYRAHRSAKGET